jgi:hypothetical protein
MFQRAKYKEDTDWRTVKDPVGTIKYDGGMFFMKFNKAGVPSFISRRQSVKGHYPDRTEKLPQFHDIKLPEYAGHVIALELIHSGNSKDDPESHNILSGILNSLPPKAILDQRIKGPVRAVMHDVIKPKIDTYGEKLNYLKQLEKSVGKPNLLYVPELHIGKDSIRQLLETTRDQGREGIIVASLTADEAGGHRVKIKHYQTYNLRIFGILQEVDIRGNPKNSTGAFQLQDGAGRHVGDVGTGLSKELREKSWKNKKSWLGRLVQVRAMPPLDSIHRKLRHPVFNGEADGEIDTI